MKKILFTLVLLIIVFPLTVNADNGVTRQEEAKIESALNREITQYQIKMILQDIKRTELDPKDIEIAEITAMYYMDSSVDKKSMKDVIKRGTDWFVTLSFDDEVLIYGYYNPDHGFYLLTGNVVKVLEAKEFAKDHLKGETQIVINGNKILIFDKNYDMVEAIDSNLVVLKSEKLFATIQKIEEDFKKRNENGPIQYGDGWTFTEKYKEFKMEVEESDLDLLAGVGFIALAMITVLYIKRK